MFIPILRFVRYDDSHLLQSMLLLDTPVSSSTGTGRSTSSSSSTVTLLDVALGNAPLSDYYHVQSSSTSSSSSSSLQAALTVTKPNQLDHSDSIPPNKQTFLRQNTPDNSDATAGSVKDATTTHDQAHTDEENNAPPEAHKGEGVEEDAGEENHIAKIEEDTVDEPDGETGATDKEEEEEEEEEEEHVIQPTRRIIPPFSWDDQLRDAHNYIQSFANVGRTIHPPRTKQHQYDPLLFFHIPKTAGTAIEYAAGMNPDRPLAWGSCRFNHTPKRDICHYPKHSQPWPQYVGWWHLPVQLFPIANNNPYENAELFGVVRDPYDRMVSEFYYICTLKVMSWRPDQCDRSRLSDVNYMNEWLSQKIRNRETDSGSSYLIDNGHFTPQYDYIYGPNQVRMLDYVLFMDQEQFNEDFQTLMNAYGLPQVQLKKLNALGATARSDTHLDTSHLDPKTIQWIHNMYPDDFAIGGYTKKSI